MTDRIALVDERGVVESTWEADDIVVHDLHRMVADHVYYGGTVQRVDETVRVGDRWPVPCVWTQDPDDDDQYKSHCGQAWVFGDWGYRESGVRFCPHCAGPVSTETSANVSHDRQDATEGEP